MARPTTGARVIQAITAPLGFFVLSLLIVETFLGTVVVGGTLDKGERMLAIWLGVSMFVFVVSAVWILTWSKPQNLTFDKDAHLNLGRPPFGTDKKQIRDRDAVPPSEAPKA